MIYREPLSQSLRHYRSDVVTGYQELLARNTTHPDVFLRTDALNTFFTLAVGTGIGMALWYGVTAALQKDFSYLQTMELFGLTDTAALSWQFAGEGRRIRLGVKR